jgi:phosphoserine phosphatase
MHPDDILSSIASMEPTSGMDQLLNTLGAKGWDILLITDANTVFVKHWLKMRGFEVRICYTYI